MSSSSEEKRQHLLAELEREWRLFNGLAASFFRVAAGRIGMTVTDMQVIDILESSGPATAGQLADLTGLTTGAITGMINRLEEAGLVQRERDPSDGRRVIVRLASGRNDRQKVGPVFASLGGAWDEMASQYDDAQLAMLLGFLKRSNELSRQEIVRLREAPQEEGRVFATPLGDQQRARLNVSASLCGLTLRANDRMADLYQARFEGSVPEVKAKAGAVTIHYPRRLWFLGKEKRAADVALSAAVPWEIVVLGAGSQLDARLGSLQLAGLEVNGSGSQIRLELPAPAGVVPVQISGSGSDIVVRRPAGVAAQVRLKGWGSGLVFDDQNLSSLGSDMRLQSRNYSAEGPRYEIEVASSGSMVTITAG